MNSGLARARVPYMHKSQHKLQRNINMTYNHISVIKQSLIIIFEKKIKKSFFFFFFVWASGRRAGRRFARRPPAGGKIWLPAAGA